MGMEKFVTGAAIGAFIIYITKDEEARKATERFIDGTARAIKNLLRRLTPTHGSKIIEGKAAPDTAAKEPDDARF